jgi:hypothetical protein
MAQYGVAIVQEPVEFQREGTLTRVKYRYDVVNTDRSEDRIALHNYGEAADLSDKGINKASTVAEKFFLCRLFHISTGGDPDGTFIAVQRNGGQQHNGRENGRPYENGRNHDHRGRSGGAQSAARDSEEFRCEQCARAVIPARKDGEMVSVKSILAASQREYQKNLCADCLLAKRAQTNAGSAPSAISSDRQVTTAPAEPQVSA